MQINLFFDKNREVQKSLSFTEGNGFSHSLSYYLKAIKENIAIDNYFFVNKFYNVNLNEYSEDFIFKNYAMAEDKISDDLMFTIVSDKLYNFNSLFFLHSDNYKRYTQIIDEYKFVQKYMALFIDNNGYIYSIRNRDIILPQDIINVKDRTRSEIRVTKLSQLTIDINMKDAFTVYSDLYLESNIKDLLILDYNESADTEMKKTYIDYSCKNTENRTKESQINEYNILISKHDIKGVINKDSTLLSSNNKKVNNHYDDLSFRTDNKNVNNDIKSITISNSDNRQIIDGSLYYERFSKHTKEMFTNNLEKLVNKKDKDVEVDSLFVMFNKNFDNLNYNKYSKFFKKPRLNIKAQSNHVFINRDKHIIQYNESYIDLYKKQRKIYFYDNINFLGIIGKEVDIPFGNFEFLGKNSNNTHVTDKDLFASVVHSSNNSIMFFNDLKHYNVASKSVIVYDTTLKINKYNHGISNPNMFLYSMSKENKSIFENDNSKLITRYYIPTKMSEYTPLLYSKYVKDAGVNDVNLKWYNKNVRDSSVNENLETSFSKYIKNASLIYNFTWIKKSLKHSSIDDNIININKSFKHIYIDDNIILYSKYSKDILIYDDYAWFLKHPKSTFKEGNLISFSKYFKNTNVNKDIRSLALSSKKTTINNYYYFTGKENKKISKEKENPFLSKFSIGIREDKMLFANRKIYNVYHKEQFKFLNRKKEEMFFNKELLASSAYIHVAIDDDIYSFSKDKKNTKLDYDFPFITVMHYDGDMKPDLGKGEIDELILPHHDFNYDKYLGKLIKEDDTINMKYVKNYNSDTEVYTVTLPIENPIDMYKDIGREYVDLDTNTLEILIYVIRTLWKDNVYKYIAMSAQDSLKHIIKESYDFINSHYTLDEDRKYEFDRALQLFRWYSEMAIINNCEYELKFDTKSKKINYITRDLGTLSDMIELDNMHISEDYILEPIDNTKQCSIKFINNKKNVLTSPVLDFKLYNINTKASISITDRYNSITTSEYKEGVYEFSEKLESEVEIDFTPTGENQSIAIANVKISNIQIRSFTVEYKGVFGEINSVMKDLLNQLLVVGDVVPQNVQDKLKDVAPVTSAVSKMKEYFDMHHKNKLKGKRLITKK